MRENNDSIGYLDINALKENLFIEIQTLSKDKLDHTCVEKDFMVISYFLGNDFLPQVFSSDIQELSKILKMYADIITTQKKRIIDQD